MTLGSLAFDDSAAKELLAVHKRQPEISAQEHARRLTIELGKSIAAKHKIYLDTKYWVLMRDAAMGRPRKAAHEELLELLRCTVTSGIALCPISDAGFIELMKQSDSKTRIATADLMDELSLGVALLQEQDRVMLEWGRMFSSDQWAYLVAQPILQMVWVKACFVLGFPYPTAPRLDPAANCLLQMATIDALWRAKLSEMISDADEPAHPTTGFEETSVKLNSASTAYYGAIPPPVMPQTHHS